MSELIVIGFKKDMYRASQVLNILRDMNASWEVDLNDAVAVYREYNGKLRVDQSYHMTTGEGAAWGGMLGGLLGALIAIPFTAGVSAVAATATAIAAGSLGGSMRQALRPGASTWKEEFGISGDFVKNVRARWCSPGTRPSSRSCGPSTRRPWPSSSGATAARS